MATISIIRVENPAEKAEISARILHALPDWFGLPDSTQKYIDDSRSMPFFAAVREGQAVGFAALKATSPCAGEIYVMGVLPEYHRSGIGQNHSVQNRPAEIRVLQNRIGKHGTAQIGTGKIGIAQIGTGKIDAFQVCAGKINAFQVCHRKIGIFKIFIGKFAVFKILAAEFYPVRHKIIRSQRRGIRRTVPMSHRTPGKP